MITLTIKFGNCIYKLTQSILWLHFENTRRACFSETSNIRFLIYLNEVRQEFPRIVMMLMSSDLSSVHIVSLVLIC